MNIIYYSVNGSVVATAHGDFYMSMYRTAKKCEANEGQVLGLTYKAAEQLIDLDLFRDAADGKGSDIVSEFAIADYIPGISLL